MTDAPGHAAPIKSWMVAMTFGLPPSQQLYTVALTSPTSEAACALAVAAMIQQQHIAEPLYGINFQELMEPFLVAALAALRGQNGGEKVLSLVPQTDPALSAPGFPTGAVQTDPPGGEPAS